MRHPASHGSLSAVSAVTGSVDNVKDSDGTSEKLTNNEHLSDTAANDGDDDERKHDDDDG